MHFASLMLLAATACAAPIASLNVVRDTTAVAPPTTPYGGVSSANPGSGLPTGSPYSNGEGGSDDTLTDLVEDIEDLLDQLLAALGLSDVTDLVADLGLKRSADMTSDAIVKRAAVAAFKQAAVAAKRDLTDNEGLVDQLLDSVKNLLDNLLDTLLGNPSCANVRPQGSAPSGSTGSSDPEGSSEGGPSASGSQGLEPYRL